MNFIFIDSKNNGLSFFGLFYIFSLIYFVFFYIAPLTFLWMSEGRVFYASASRYFSYEQLVIAMVLGILFWASFSLASFFFFRNGEANKKSVVNNGLMRLKFLSTLYMIFYIIYFALFNDIDHIYAVRQGDAQGSHLIFFLHIFFTAFGIFLIFKLDEFGFKKYAMALLVLIFFSGLFGGAGRYAIVLSLCMTFILSLQLKIDLKKLFFGFLLFIFLIPIIINLKSIIYQIGVHGDVANLEISEFYEFKNFAELYFMNFGHPVISLLLAESTINEIGYRFFYDYLHGFLFFFRIFGFDFGDSLTYFNTYTILGLRASIVPPGYIAFGFMQLHFFGVIISGVAFAFVGYICKNFFGHIAPNSNLAKFYFSLTAANSFYHGEVRIIVMTIFLAGVLMIIFNKTIKLKLKM